MSYQKLLLSAFFTAGVFAGCSPRDSTLPPPGTSNGNDAGIPTTINATCKGVDAGSAEDAGTVCTCPTGYELDGRICRFIDECAAQEIACGENAECVPLIGSHKCVCKAGFKGDGGFCQPTGNTCDSCDTHASCIHNESGSFCRCDSGYTGDGMTCTPTSTDSCQNNDCDFHATCHSNGAAYSCICNDGYTGNGFTCTLNPNDPCSSATCDVHATCHSSGSSYSCTCNSGYTGNGMTCTATTTDACTNNDCDSHATCHSNGASYSCTCNSGYSGDGFSCAATSDPCSNNICDPHATCHVNGASYTCTCDSGYTGNGFSCTATSTGGLVGDVCTGTAETQGSCASGELCSQFNNYSGGSFLQCTINCSDDSACGTTSGFSNICVGGDNGFCVQGCNSNSDCRHSGFTCWSELNAESTGLQNFCWQDCRSNPAGICGYFAICNASGACTHRSCTTNSNCLTGQVCAVDAGACVKDCRSNGCTGAATCNQSSGLCELAPYQSCAAHEGVCKGGAFCISFGGDNARSICMGNCTSGVACPSSPSGQTCNVDLGDGNSVCSVPCTAGTTTCPTNTTCQSFGSLSFCAP